MLEVYNLSQDLKWKNIVDSADISDFYHTYDYHTIAKKNNEGEPKLFVYRRNNSFIAIPFLERIIEDDKKYKDLTSVYGYAGPIYSGIINDSLLNEFEKEFNLYLVENNIVSVFSRLHPLIKQEEILKNLGNIDSLSKTVTIELELSLEEQRRKYRKSNKSEINKLRKSIICEKAINSEQIDKFISIYFDNMKRVNADERYFFDKNYFYDFINSKDFDTKVIIAKDNDNIIAGAMFVFSDKIVQYHLAGTDKNYLSLTPMKLILDEVRIESTNRGFKYFHLGGGVGSSEDSLFKFKSGFSDRYDQFKIWKYIVLPEVYQKLINNKDKIFNKNFFPLYRG